MSIHTDDKELLKKAAEAAGYKAEWREWVTSRVAEFAMIKNVKYEGFWIDGKLWNPLTDDGDALRLAVKLGQCVTIEGHGRTVAISVTGFECEEINRDNPYAATRRAIVRAAAEIGKGMK